MMDKIFHFDSPRDEYRADAAVVWCFDQRFEVSFAKFLKRRGVAIVDAIKLAGGAKSLASPERETDREFVLGQIQKSIRLHGTRRVILMVHSDCGGYGGLANFGGNTTAEAQHHEGELRRAAEYLAQQIPGVDVQAYFADFEGVWAVDLAPAAAQ